MRTPPGVYIGLFILGSWMISCSRENVYREPPTQPIPSSDQVLIGDYSQNPSLAFYGGTGSPVLLGDTGDYYLDLKSGNLYGPFNANNGWGPGTPLKHDSSMSHIYSGPNIPPPAVGQAGDFYLDLWLFQLYGPKTDSSGWGNAISLYN
jgi:hypothetical protein